MSDQSDAALQAISEAINTLERTMATTFPRTTGTTNSATAGSAGALPALPAGYLTVVHPDTGATIKVPYYT